MISKDMTTATAGAPAEQALSSRWIHLFTALCYLSVALGFSYMDRHYGNFAVESFLWVIWAGLGFSMGALMLHSERAVASTASGVMTAFALLVAVFPAFFIYGMARWICVVLLLVIAARGPGMYARRDLYLTLATCFAVSFMAATHPLADWTLWFYLGPAWVFAGLALTWDYASSRAIGHLTRLGMNLAFIGITLVIALALFVFLPRPPVLGFGFIPPPTPGLSDPFDDAQVGKGPPSSKPGDSGKGGASGNRPGQGGPGGQGDAGPGNAGGAGGGFADRWQDMLDKMSPALNDKAIPQWQRNLLGKLLDLMSLTPGPGEPYDGSPTSGKGQSEGELPSLGLPPLWWWLLALLGLVLCLLAWRFRYWLGIELMHGCAWASSRHLPQLSMQMSMQAMKWCLMDAGHKPKPGQSLREYLADAPRLPQLSRRWFNYAMALYCETRFGNAPATTARARNMREAVSAATQLVKGHSPELAGR